jgi:hypothetical protein
MKNSAKKLRGMHDKLMKEYDKKYASKKKAETKLNESLYENEGVKKPLAQLTFADVLAVFPNIGQWNTKGLKYKIGVNFPNIDDSENVVYTEQDFENWKSRLMSETPEVTIELDPSTRTAIVHGEEYKAKRAANIIAKHKSMISMFKRR